MVQFKKNICSSGPSLNLVFLNPSTAYWMDIFHFDLLENWYCLFAQKAKKRPGMAHLNKEEASIIFLYIFEHVRVPSCSPLPQFLLRNELQRRQWPILFKNVKTPALIYRVIKLCNLCRNDGFPD